MEMIRDLLAGLSALGLTVGIAVGVAWRVFKSAGEKWLSSKFAERLEELKHVHQRELERLKLTINTSFDRTTKLHNQEFSVLPELWAKCNKAYAHVGDFTSPMQYVIDLDSFSQ